MHPIKTRFDGLTRHCCGFAPTMSDPHINSAMPMLNGGDR